MDCIICKNCYKPIVKGIFCGRSCSMLFLNKNKKNKIKQEIKSKVCALCSEVFSVKRKSDGKFSRATRCPKCSFFVNHNKTKGEFFKIRKNWQAARSNIQKYARNVYLNSGKDMKCSVCGYDIHVEICHLKSVSSFSDDALISEINDVNNLMPLCPNHHWEFDNGY